MRQLVINQRYTDRTTTSFQKYLNDVKAMVILTHLEEMELVKKIRVGIPKEANIARRILIESNLRFVISVAKQYAGTQASLEDLVNEGNYGLIEAVEHYDETKGFKFISYAVFWIRRFIFEYINTVKPIRLPINKIQNVTKINRIISKLEQELRRPITPDDLISQNLDFDDDEIFDLFKINELNVTSYNKKIVDGEIGELIDLLPSDSNADSLGVDNNPKLIIERGMVGLPERDVKIVKSLFGLDGGTPKNLTETGEQFGLSRERVRQIKDKALVKIGTKING